MRRAILLLSTSLLLAAVPLAGASPVCQTPHPLVTACADADTATVTADTAPVNVFSHPTTTATTVHVGPEQDALVRAWTVQCGTDRFDPGCSTWAAGAGPGADGAVRAYECYVWCAEVVQVGPGAEASAAACVPANSLFAMGVGGAEVLCPNSVDSDGNVAANDHVGACIDPLPVSGFCAGGGATLAVDGATGQVTWVWLGVNGVCEAGVVTQDCDVWVTGDPRPGGALTVTIVPSGPCGPFVCSPVVDQLTVGVPAAPGQPVPWSHTDCFWGACVVEEGTVGPEGAYAGIWTPAPQGNATVAESGAHAFLQQACGGAVAVGGCAKAFVDATPEGARVRQEAFCFALPWYTCPAYAQVDVSVAGVCTEWDAHVSYDERRCVPS